MNSPDKNLPATLGELRARGYEPTPVKLEMRRNLIRKLEAGDDLFPGILGYDETVIPEITNAVLSRHDMLFLGLRGQGKTRMLRMLTGLLDEFVPVVEGSEIHDDPLAPVSRYARDLVEQRGDDMPVAWIGRDERYHEKLATPDVTIADLIGEVDLIKHAEGRHLSSEDVMHFGLIPRSHRGIFCMNELPDLSPKIQVGLFNVLEERDIQIRGFTVRLPLDLCMVFSANPEDYTNRGRIVTPLKDRIGSVVRTHYPLSRDIGARITEENAWTDRGGAGRVAVPHFLQEVIEETSRLARTSPHVNHASGVSVRMSIANYENLVSNAERRGILASENPVVARPSDLGFAAASSRGKLELAMSEEAGDEDRLIERIVEEAVKTVFDEHLQTGQFDRVTEFFESGNRLKISDGESTAALLEQIDGIRGFRKQVDRIAAELEPELAAGETAAGTQAAVAELILDGLYAHNRINKRSRRAGVTYGA
ncbi:MAG: magnesium chelatase [Planctomycetota bacterium]|nr:MAG: magnesium chelatase [Planctomycetota bacterium]REK28988.1 MAG: magnesium chelatase [Planctomycetota bacterium]REK39578.1 MAG: magnesium chelatase [Planctomycetota bacterium]